MVRTFRLIATVLALVAALLVTQPADAVGGHKLKVAVRGLSTGVKAKVVVKGPHGYTKRLSRTTTLRRLAPGKYVVRAKPVSTVAGSFEPTPSIKRVKVTAAKGAKVTIRYAAPPTVRVSVATGGAQALGGPSAGDEPPLSSAMSPDGRYVAFHSPASNLVAGDHNNSWDVFLRDRALGTTNRVSVATGGAQGNGSSGRPDVSADGRYVVFNSFAPDLVPGDTNGLDDVFLRDLAAGTTTRVSVATGGGQVSNGPSSGAQVSDDGRYVAFTSSATDVVADDTNLLYDVFVRDVGAGTTTRVSLADDESQAIGGYSILFSMSADGRFVAFRSGSTNLVAGDTNQVDDVFVRDLALGTTTRVNVAGDASQAGGDSNCGSLNAAGNKVVFLSAATNLVPGDTNGLDDVFVRDLALGTTTRVNVANDGSQADSWSGICPSLSADGRFVGFESNARSLVAGDTNGRADVFLRDLALGTTTRVSVAADGAQANGWSAGPVLSGNARYVVFDSNATNLVPGDSNNAYDVFVRRRGN